MYKVKEWCAEAMSRSLNIVHGLVLGGGERKQNSETKDLINTVVKAETSCQQEATVDSSTGFFENVSAIEKFDQHICVKCNEQCFHCVTLTGTDVDLRQPEFLQKSLKVKTSDASTQTCHETNSIDLPDLLCMAPTKVSSPQLQPVSTPPPPPPPPAPPLPPPMPSSLTLFSRKKKTEGTPSKQKTANRRKSGALSAAPEITEEAIKKVKLKKPEERVLRSQSNVEKSSPRLSAFQPLITKEALQKVSLRKAASVDNSSCSPRRKLSGTKENFECRTGEVIDVKQFLKRTRLSRSPGGTPLPIKRVKQPTTPKSSNGI